MPVDHPFAYFQPDGEIDESYDFLAVDPITGLPEDIDRLGNARADDDSFEGMPLPDVEDICPSTIAGTSFWSQPSSMFDPDDLMTDEIMLGLILSEEDKMKQQELICESIINVHGETVIKHFAAIPSKTLATDHPYFFEQGWVISILHSAGTEAIAELMKMSHIPSILAKENDEDLCVRLFERALLEKNETLSRQLLEMPTLCDSIRSGNNSLISLALNTNQETLAFDLIDIVWPKTTDTPKEVLCQIGLNTLLSRKTVYMADESIELLKDQGLFSPDPSTDTKGHAEQFSAAPCGFFS
jgi:hypothetical protein